MGIIKKLFGDSSEADNQSAINWTKLNRITDVEGMIDLSEQYTVLIFKHSNRCGISSSVLSRFERQAINYEMDHLRFYLLNVVDHRNISNEISEQLSVHHESPQLIVIKNRKVIAHDSHYEVLNMDLQGN